LVFKKFKEMVKEPTLNLSFKQSILVFKKFKEMVKEPTLNLSFFRAFFEQTRQSFNFFLKLETCTYFKSFNKNPEPGLFECENFQKLRLRCYNKILEEPNIWFKGQTRCGLSLLNIETKFACCWLVSLST